MSAICFEPATHLSGLLQKREISATELLAEFKQQINHYNPDLNAIVTLSLNLAAQQAAASDQRLAAGNPRSQLDGIPLAVKDKFHLGGVRTTYGSPYYADHVPDADDLIVARERAAGAVFLGKTNVPEFSFGGHTDNPIFGLTLNPYDLNVSTSGSSGGSAVALASGMTALANGSDIDGHKARIAWSADMSGSDMHVDIAEDMLKVMEPNRPIFEKLGLHITDACPPVRLASELLDQYKCLAALSRVGEFIDDKPELFKTTIHNLVDRARQLSADDIVGLARSRSHLWQQYCLFFDHFDFFIWPVNPCNPVSLDGDDYGLEWPMLDPQPLLGLPSISVPCGFSDKGHPVGIQITGRRGDDIGVIQLAYAFERETEFWRRKPEL